MICRRVVQGQAVRRIVADDLILVVRLHAAAERIMNLTIRDRIRRANLIVVHPWVLREASRRKNDRIRLAPPVELKLRRARRRVVRRTPQKRSDLPPSAVEQARKNVAEIEAESSRADVTRRNQYDERDRERRDRAQRRRARVAPIRSRPNPFIVIIVAVAARGAVPGAARVRHVVGCWTTFSPSTNHQHRVRNTRTTACSRCPNQYRRSFYKRASGERAESGSTFNRKRVRTYIQSETCMARGACLGAIFDFFDFQDHDNLSRSRR